MKIKLIILLSVDKLNMSLPEMILLEAPYPKFCMLSLKTNKLMTLEVIMLDFRLFSSLH